MVTGGHDRGAVLADGDGAHLAQVVQAHLVERHGPVFRHQGGAGEDGDVLQGRLATLAEGRCPHRRHLQDAAVLVHHQGGEGFPIHLFRQDHQGLAGPGHCFQHGHQVGDGADLAVGDQQQRVLELAHAAITVGDEIGGAVAPIEGHALGDFQLGGQALALLHGDHAIGGDLLHGLGDHLPHFLVATGAHGGHLADGVPGHGAGVGFDALHQLSHGLVHAAAHAHGVGAGGHVAQALTGHGLGQNRGGGGAVAGLVLGLGGHLQQQFGADVLERILEFDFLGDGDAVIHDVRGAELLLQHHVPALGADGDLDRIGQGVDTALEGGAGGVGEQQQLGHGARQHREEPWPQAPMPSGGLAGGESRMPGWGRLHPPAPLDRVPPMEDSITEVLTDALADPAAGSNLMVFLLVAGLGLGMALIYVPLRIFLTMTARSRRLKLLQRIRRLREELAQPVSNA